VPLVVTESSVNALLRSVRLAALFTLIKPAKSLPVLSKLTSALARHEVNPVASLLSHKGLGAQSEKRTTNGPAPAAALATALTVTRELPTLGDAVENLASTRDAKEALAAWWPVVDALLVDRTQAARLGDPGRYWLGRLLARMAGVLEAAGRPDEAGEAWRLIVDRGLPGGAIARARLGAGSEAASASAARRAGAGFTEADQEAVATAAGTSNRKGLGLQAKVAGARWTGRKTRRGSDDEGEEAGPPASSPPPPAVADAGFVTNATLMRCGSSGWMLRSRPMVVRSASTVTSMDAPGSRRSR
jgi:hypothetical protein